MVPMPLALRVFSALQTEILQADLDPKRMRGNRSVDQRNARESQSKQGIDGVGRTDLGLAR